MLYIDVPFITLGISRVRLRHAMLSRLWCVLVPTASRSFGPRHVPFCPPRDALLLRALSDRVTVFSPAFSEFQARVTPHFARLQ